MSQEQALLSALKRQLKLQNLTYVDVSKHLGLSEASIKRLFTQGQISVGRLESICQLAQITLTDLVLIAKLEQRKISSLTMAQEQEIVGNDELLIVTVCVTNGYSFDEIIEQFDISHTQCIQHLAHLDRLKLIELQPENRIKLLVSPTFNWLVNGPIQRYFLTHIKEAFFQSAFKDKTEKLLVINGLLSEGSNSEMQDEMQQLVSNFAKLKSNDQRVAMNSKHGTTLVVALRQWNAELFETKMRKP